MKSIKFFLALAILLFVIIVLMLWYLITTPAKLPMTEPTTQTNQGATSTASASSSAPLSPGVTLTAPLPHAIVARSFTVSGVAPNTWYFEAVFPIEVRDLKNNQIGSAQARAGSDWTVEGPVPFSSTITIAGNYSGPALLILKRDNPSGLAQNDEEAAVPIVIK